MKFVSFSSARIALRVGQTCSKVHSAVRSAAQGRALPLSAAKVCGGAVSYFLASRDIALQSYRPQFLSQSWPGSIRAMDQLFVVKIERRRTCESLIGRGADTAVVRS